MLQPHQSSTVAVSFRLLTSLRRNTLLPSTLNSGEKLPVGFSTACRSGSFFNAAKLPGDGAMPLRYVAKISSADTWTARLTWARLALSIASK
ncbi:hypothetical protein D9M71_733750 [compost metagenome]